MNARVRFSVKGQVVIPKDVRDRYHFHPGGVADLVETVDGVLIRKPSVAKPATFDDALNQLHAIVDYNGPRLDEADWRRGIADAVRKKWGDRRS